LFDIRREVIILINIKQRVERKVEIFAKFTSELGTALKPKYALFFLREGSIDALVKRCASYRACDCCLREYADGLVRASSSQETSIEIAQVLVAVLILIDRVVKTLGVQKICIDLLILVTRRHAVRTLAATLSTRPALI
jgi:hypothetical protein